VSRHPPRTRFVALTARLLRGLWFGVIPALAAGVVVRYLFPPVWHPAAQGWARGLVKYAASHTLLLGVVLFVAFALVTRGLAEGLPGAELLIATPASGPSSERGAPAQPLIRTALWLGMVALVAIGLRTLVAQPYEVLGGSMLPTAEPSSYLLVNKLAYGVHLPHHSSGLASKAPRRADVIVFESPVSKSESMVKRVVGVPGDRIRVDGGFLEINGWKVPRCLAGHYFTASERGYEAGPVFVEFLEDRAYLMLRTRGNRPPFGPYVVKEGEVFVLGDSRTTSVDSRVWNEGRGQGVPLAAVTGRVDRFVIGASQSGTLDFQGLFKRIGTDLPLTRVNTNMLRDGIRHCLTKRPNDTYPPPPKPEARISFSQDFGVKVPNEPRAVAESLEHEAL
jgi:signal peptidase I